VYLVDIGNRFAHLYDGKCVNNLSYKELVNNFSTKKLYYINVNSKIKDNLLSNSNWINLESYVYLKGAYEGMGVDRKVLLKSYKSGIFIDAGSAITIDLKKDDEFLGGTIIPGIWQLKKSYKEISSVLSIEKLKDIDLLKLPNSTTKMSVSYGIIAPIVALVNTINKGDLPIYCTGGDGKLLSKYLNAKYDGLLIFKGMNKVIKENNLC